jgi:hypothetical protein
MKRILLFLAVTGLASASAITLGSWDPLGASDLINAPGDTFSPVGGQAVTATVGGLCTGPAAACPTTGSGLTPDVLTFTLSTASALNILLQDLDSAGDVYEVVLTDTGTSQAYDYNSTVVSIGGTTAQSCYQSTFSAFATADNSCMNVTTPTLAAGNYSINVWDVILSYVGGTSPFGGAVPSQTTQFQTGRYSPAAFDLEVNPATTVPEPASLALLGLGGIAAGLLRRRTAK